MLNNLPEPTPAYASVAAPWTLEGRGLIILARFPEQMLTEQTFLPESLKASRRGRLGAMMFVDYARSPVGPYRELLFVPGTVLFGHRRCRTISRIFVSTMESVVNGRRNWGIPKDCCDFQVEEDAASGVISVAASIGNKNFAEFSYSAGKLGLPVNAALCPKSLLTLGQRWEQNDYFYTPGAKGRISTAQVKNMRFDSQYFPDMTQGSMQLAIAVPKFEMVFPKCE